MPNILNRNIGISDYQIYISYCIIMVIIGINIGKDTCLPHYIN